MKKLSSILFFTLIIAYLFSLFVSPTIKASSTNIRQFASSSTNIQAEVDHVLEVRYGGLTILNDTVKLSSPIEENIQNFSIGFPYIYKSNLFHCFAYNSSNPNQQFNLIPDTGLVLPDTGFGAVGYYGVTVIFPQSVSLSKDKIFSFTVSFIFSDVISTKSSEKVTVEDDPETSENETKTETVTVFQVNFPAYPSLVLDDNASCNVKAILPKNATYEASSIPFNEPMLQDNKEIVNYTKASLERLSYEFAWLNFSISEKVPVQYRIPIVEIKEMTREIKLDEWKHIFVSDLFTITNRAIRFPSPIFMRLPQGVFGVSAFDEAGNKFSTLLEEANTTTYRIALLTAPKQNETIKIKVTYKLPWDKYINQESWNNIRLNLAPLNDPNWMPKKLTVTFFLPEGAKIVDVQSRSSESKIEKNVFMETITFTYYPATLFQYQTTSITYSYLPFWNSFRPTLWIGVAIAIIGVVVYLWQARKPTVAAPVFRIPIRPEFLKEFTDAYERKTKTLIELESLEQQVKRGRIPRRQYKVRKQMLEGRISSISKDLSNLSQKIRAAGPRYADIMRQLEVAETEMEGANREIARIEARYRGGELSKEAYRRLWEEYEKRRDHAKTTIDGVLLRLKEEIH